MLVCVSLNVSRSSRRSSRTPSCPFLSYILASSRSSPHSWVIQTLTSPQTHPRLCRPHLCFHLVWVHDPVQGFHNSPPARTPPSQHVLHGFQHRLRPLFSLGSHPFFFRSRSPLQPTFAPKDEHVVELIHSPLQFFLHGTSLLLQVRASLYPALWASCIRSSKITCDVAVGCHALFDLLRACARPLQACKFLFQVFYHSSHAAKVLLSATSPSSCLPTEHCMFHDVLPRLFSSWIPICFFFQPLSTFHKMCLASLKP